jgi:hypothetical protein
MKGVRICSMLILVLFGVWTLPVGCGGGGGGSESSGGSSGSSGGVCGSLAAQTIAATATNVQPITVNGGPEGVPNAAFTSVKICLHGTTTCQTIANVLVDTGSFGLRLLSSALTSGLYTTPTTGTTLGECVQFADGSYVWGPLETFDVFIAGETASSVPVHVLDPNFYASKMPSACSSGGGPEDDTLATLGANGILGIGPIQYDCGNDCVNDALFPVGQVYPYYNCSSLSCVKVSVTLTQQVQNPVALFSTDNNGVIVELPAVSGPAASLSGSLVFGIGTQSNNGLGSANVLTLNSNASISTTYKGTTLPYSFIDSGSNGYFFPDSTIPKDSSEWYIPSSTLSLSAINEGNNGTSSNVCFSVGNADSMPNDAVLNTLAGYVSPSFGYFDWGLPFFYGRNVYTSITTDGNGSYWAY